MSMRNAIRSLRGLNDWRLWVAGIVTAIGVAAVESRGVWSTPGRQSLMTAQLALYWALWLLWPLALLFLLALISHLARGRVVRALLSAVLLSVTATLLWAGFFEPRELEVRETAVGTSCGVRVALVADLHAGLFVRQADLDRLVTRLNALDVDAVLVAGDWTYGPKRDLRAQFAPLASLRHRVYGVLGNHDEEQPGPPIQQPLRAALQAFNVQLIDGRRVTLGRCELSGVGDLKAGSAQRDLGELAKSRAGKPAAQRIALVHNPDTVFSFDPGFAAVTLAGHTHGGQVDLPLVTDRLLARHTRGGFKRGLYPMPATQLFVTSGTGTSHLPLRLRMPPVIDVLTL